MTTSRGHPAQPHHVSLKEAVAPLRIQHRDRIHALARWSMAQGRPVPMEHAALILEAEDLDGARDPGSQLLIMRAWCQGEHVAVPPGLDQSLLVYLDFLEADG